MQDANNNHPQRLGGIDPAALAAATLSAVLSITLQDGAYTPLSFVVGITVGILIFAYDVDPYRTKMQSLAFAGVIGLISSLSIGFLIELAAACLFNNTDCTDIYKGTTKTSSLNTLHISLICIFTTLLVYKWERCKQNKVEAASTPCLTTPTDAGNSVEIACEGSDQNKDSATL